VHKTKRNVFAQRNWGINTSFKTDTEGDKAALRIAKTKQREKGEISKNVTNETEDVLKNQLRHKDIRKKESPGGGGRSKTRAE